MKAPFRGLLPAVLCLSLSAPASAAEISIVAGDLPPMVSADGMGHEATIVREALGLCGHSATIDAVPFTRNWAEFKAGRYDAVMTVPVGMDLGGVASVPYVRYRNGASVLKESGLSVTGLGDLAGRRVVAFAGARGILPGLAEAIPGFAEYREFADQLFHSNALFAGRVDAVLGDGLIFAEYNRRLVEKVDGGVGQPFDPRKPVTFTAIFPPTPYTMVFRDVGLRDDFDRCFGRLRDEGGVDAIMKAAVAPYRATVGDQYLGY